MPLLNCDVKSLEIVVAAQLSNDAILMAELRDKVDTHEVNRVRFNLPDRVTAKRFVFKLLYGATAYGYSTDGDFHEVGLSQNQWQDVIDEFYSKYTGIANWHKQLILEAQTNGRIVIPSGRYYPIVPDYKKREPWPLTVIKNYPVQGFGAELVALARLRCNQLIHESGIEAKLVGTIHDSIVVDTTTENVYNISKILKQSVEEVPAYVKRLFNYDFTLPLTCEVAFGPNKKEMKEIHFD